MRCASSSRLPETPLKAITVPPRRTVLTASRQPLDFPVASTTTSASRASPSLAPNARAAGDDHLRARILEAGAEEHPHRPRAEHGHRLTGFDALGRVQRTG